MIHMQLSSKDFSYCIPSDFNLDEIVKSKPFVPFDERVIEFLDSWSKEILKDKEARLYPDAVTFAFWIRKGSIIEMKKAYDERNHDLLRLGKGVTFHIAPGNVPINFAYTFVAGLISGNASIVRISSKPFRQVNLLCEKIQNLLAGEFADLKPYMLFVQYDRGRKDITDCFSSFADTRVIWGGDNTINEIRKSPLPPRGNEICFADRYSIAVINADEVVNNEKDLSVLARDFYNDTFLFDQNACTTPHLIAWLGREREKGKDLFWNAVHAYTEKNYNLAPVTAVDKLTAFCKEGMELGAEAVREASSDNLIVRVKLSSLSEDIEEYRSVGGYFNEIDIASLDEIAPAVTRKFQTLSYYGVNKKELVDFIKNNRLVGIDRVVPVGKTLDFNLIWDGYDLVNQMSREASVL